MLHEWRYCNSKVSIKMHNYTCIIILHALKVCQSPLQQNSYDCGVFTCMVTIILYSSMYAKLYIVKGC